MRLSAIASQTVTLTWNPSTDTNVAGYKIYYGVASLTYTNSIAVGNVTNTIIGGLADGTTYFFAATTYDASGAESALSNEASYQTGGTNANVVSTNSVPPTNAPSGGTSQPPTLNALGNLNINENAGLRVVNFSGISLGTGGQLTISAVSSNPALIPNPAVNYTSPNANGTLTFAPAVNGNGTATITVTADNGNNLVTQIFVVTVNAVNQPPTLNPLGNLSLNVNAGLQTVALSGITSGAANEKQTLKVTASSSNTALILNPTVNYTSPNTTGKLSFNPRSSATGTATITVTVNDGGKSNNIVTQKFTVTVVKATVATKPVIMNQLTNHAAVQGQTATFAVTVAGKAPFKYQWELNGVNLPAATSPTLTVNNISTNKAGVYSVTVSNNSGSTNSPIAALSVYSTAAASLTSATRANGQFTFTVSGVPGYQYIVQASSDYVNWIPVQTNTAPFTFTDTNAGQFNQRFYRTVYISP